MGRRLCASAARRRSTCSASIDGQPIVATAIKVDLDVPGFNLVRVQDLVPQLEGQVNAHAEVRGTIGKPVGKLQMAINALQLGAMKYDKFLAPTPPTTASRPRRRSTRTRSARRQPRRQRDAAAGSEGGPLVASLRANGFYVDIDDVGLTNPRLLKGKLDASLDVHGLRANPTMQGTLKLDKGQLALEGDARIYQDIQVDVALQNGLVTLQATPRPRCRTAA